MIIRRYTDDDAEQISKIIIRNLFEVNSVDYGMVEMEAMAKRFRPVDIVELNRKRVAFVAIDKGEVLGTGSITNDFCEDLTEYWVLTVFVNPDCHRQNIGRQIMSTLEDEALKLGCKHLILPSSLTSHLFYKKLDYKYIGGRAVINDHRQYMMEKYL